MRIRKIKKTTVLLGRGRLLKATVLLGRGRLLKATVLLGRGRLLKASLILPSKRFAHPLEVFFCSKELWTQNSLLLCYWLALKRNSVS